MGMSWPCRGIREHHPPFRHQTRRAALRAGESHRRHDQPAQYCRDLQAGVDLLRGLQQELKLMVAAFRLARDRWARR